MDDEVVSIGRVTVYEVSRSYGVEGQRLLRIRGIMTIVIVVAIPIVGWTCLGRDSLLKQVAGFLIGHMGCPEAIAGDSPSGPSVEEPPFEDETPEVGFDSLNHRPQ